MKYIENNDAKSVTKFTKKFIANYIVAFILIGIVYSVVIEGLTEFFGNSLVVSIANFILLLVFYYLICSIAVKTSLKEVNINSNNIDKVKRNMLIFFICILVVELVFLCMSFYSSINIIIAFVGASYINILLIGLIISIITKIIVYITITMFCRSKLEEVVLGKPINKIIYIVILVILIGLNIFTAVIS